MSKKFTAPIREKSLNRARYLGKFIPGHRIVDFVSAAVDRAFKSEVRRRKIAVDPELDFARVNHNRHTHATHIP